MELFLEATIDSLASNAISNFTQKHLDKRYKDGDFELTLAECTLHPGFGKDFLECVLHANATFGATSFIASQSLPNPAPNGAYTLVVRFYKVSRYIKDESFIEDYEYSRIEKMLKDAIHNCDAKFYSDDPSFLFQGCWEGLAKNNMSIFKYTGPKGKGIWDGIHNASGGLSNSQIHLTKHLSQFIVEVDNFIPKMAQMLKVV